MINWQVPPEPKWIEFKSAPTTAGGMGADLTKVFAAMLGAGRVDLLEGKEYKGRRFRHVRTAGWRTMPDQQSDEWCYWGWQPL